MPNQVGVPLRNPWTSIWVKPRQTIAEIVRKNPSFRFFFLCFIYGFSALLHTAQNGSFGLTHGAPAILLAAAILAFFVGFASISIASLLLTWTGKWLGGVGRYVEVRSAIAWSNVPRVVDILVWTILAFLFGSMVFTQDFALGARALALVGIVQYALIAWTLVILIVSLSEVHGFSLFKAILNILISIFLVIAVVWIAFLVNWWLQG